MTVRSDASAPPVITAQPVPGTGRTLGERGAAPARLDMTLLFAWCALMLVGLVMVTSAAAGRDEGTFHYLLRHGVYMAMAVGLFAVVAAIPLRFWEIIHRPCLLLAFVVCLLVFMPGLSAAAKGAQRWIDLGLVRFQPAEAAKLLAIVYLAGYIARSGSGVGANLAALFKPVFWFAVLMGVILLQRDFGTTVVLALVMGGMLFLGGARPRDFALLVLLGSVLLAGAAVLEPYRVVRLLTFTDPWADQLDAGYQLTQALIGFGRGEFSGLGLGEGVQKLFYLPEAHNDFIYAVIAEELGLFGAVGILGLLAFVTVRLFGIGRAGLASQRAFAGSLAYGAGLLIGIQTLINVGVNTGVLPTKGLTLPFISFGGNSLLVCSAAVAMALRADYEGRAAIGDAAKLAASDPGWVRQGASHA